MTSTIFRMSAHAVAGVALLAATPAVRAEDPATVGVLATLGINAAAGKTTLGDSAGAIEAGLYGTEAFQQAGAIVASIVNARRFAADGSRRPVLLLARGETIDLVSSSLVYDRIVAVDRLVRRECAGPVTTPARRPLYYKQNADGTLSALVADDAAAPAAATPRAPFLGKLGAADLVGAATIDTAIGGIALSVDDRMLLNAVLMNGSQPQRTWVADGTGWVRWPYSGYGQKGPADATGSAPADFWIASEATAMPPAPPVRWTTCDRPMAVWRNWSSPHLSDARARRARRRSWSRMA